MITDPFRILDADVVGLDTETTGLHPPRDRAFGVSLWSKHGGGYFDLRQDFERLRDALRGFRGLFVAHNASFDFRSLAAAGIQLDPERFDDTAVRAALIYEHHFSYQLDALAKICLGKSKETQIYTELAQIFGGRATRNVQMKHLPDAPPEIVAKYAIVDAQLVYELWIWQRGRIAAEGLQQVADFERAKMPALFRMAQAGIRVDLERAEQSANELTPIIDDYLRQLEAEAGFEVNVNAPADVAKLFDPVPDEATGAFRSKWGDLIPATDGGAPSMAAPALRAMSSPMAKLVIDTRSLIKTRDTFLRGHVIGHSFAGRVFPSINQSKTDAGSGTATGRLSYTDPALQQIPSRNKRVAQLVKSVFLPEEDQVWVDADLASFEVRVFAHFAAANNPMVADAYKANPELDFHQYVADLTGLPRSPQVGGGANAKQLNLSMIFNSGNGAVAEQMGLPWEWAEFKEKSSGKIVRYKKAGSRALEVIAQYHTDLPGVREFAEHAKAAVVRRANTDGIGYVLTRTGRRIRFPDTRKAYKASGLLIQSTAAELNKAFIERLEAECREVGGRLLLNTHDSYSMSLPRENVGEHASRMKRAVETCTDWLRVPIVLEINQPSTNWYGSWSADRML